MTEFSRIFKDRHFWVLYKSAQGNYLYYLNIRKKIIPAQPYNLKKTGFWHDRVKNKKILFQFFLDEYFWELLTKFDDILTFIKNRIGQATCNASDNSHRVRNAWVNSAHFFEFRSCIFSNPSWTPIFTIFVFKLVLLLDGICSYVWRGCLNFLEN